jgi:ribosome-binding ATPase YchF (GTP1/OBG family)
VAENISHFRRQSLMSCHLLQTALVMMFFGKGKNVYSMLCYSKVPAFLNVVDIAGLVKGASEGQGLGNAFLSHIKACDAIFHLCRKWLC